MFSPFYFVLLTRNKKKIEAWSSPFHTYQKTARMYPNQGWKNWFISNSVTCSRWRWRFSSHLTAAAGFYCNAFDLEEDAVNHLHPSCVNHPVTLWHAAAVTMINQHRSESMHKPPHSVTRRLVGVKKRSHSFPALSSIGFIPGIPTWKRLTVLLSFILLACLLIHPHVLSYVLCPSAPPHGLPHLLSTGLNSSPLLFCSFWVLLTFPLLPLLFPPFSITPLCS